MNRSATTLALPIAPRILLIRGQKVMIDIDLAALYGLSAKALIQAVKRNSQRFPAEAMFQLTAAEKSEALTHYDRLGKLRFSKALPFAFTKQGAIQATLVLALTRRWFWARPWCRNRRNRR